jgi:TPR repeat protein
VYKKNEATAWKWCEKAARQGYAQAYKSLCDFYMHRTSTDEELLKVINTKWCKKAIDTGQEVNPDTYGILGIKPKAPKSK